MDFTKAQTAEEHLLLTLIHKVEDNTAAINKMLDRDSDRNWMDCEGNVLKGWMPPKCFDVEQEAKWIRNELEDHCRYYGNWPKRQVCRSMWLYYEENAKHLQASGFDLRDHMGEVLRQPWGPREVIVSWTPK